MKKICIFCLCFMSSCAHGEVTHKDIFLLDKKTKEGRCKVKLNKRLADASTKGSENYALIKEKIELENVTLEKGDKLGWSESKCQIEWIQFTNKTTFGGYEWLGVDLADANYQKSTFMVQLEDGKFQPREGLLGEGFKHKGRVYKKWHYLCLDAEGTPRSTSTYSANTFKISDQGAYDDTCEIMRGRLGKDTEIEGVMWKKGTSFKFDRNGKWDHVRMVPGQKFQGKVYKDGGMLFRGNYNKYQKDYGPDDVRIRTPDEEDYDQIEVTKAY